MPWSKNPLYSRLCSWQVRVLSCGEKDNTTIIKFQRPWNFWEITPNYPLISSLTHKPCSAIPKTTKKGQDKSYGLRLRNALMCSTAVAGNHQRLEQHETVLMPINQGNGRQRAAMLSRGPRILSTGRALAAKPQGLRSNPRAQETGRNPRVVLRHPQAFSGLYAHVHTYIGLILKSVLKEVQLYSR